MHSRWLGKAANSPTLTTWLVQLVIPVRLLLLTPLVLRSFTKTELDVFYLLASTNLLFNIFQARLTDAFMKMLAGAHAGSPELGVSTSKQVVGDGTPNWPLFERCYRCLAILLLVAAIPAFLFSLATAWYAVGKLTGFNYEDLWLWAAVGLGVLTAPVTLYYARPVITLSAIGRISDTNRVRFGTELGCVICSVAAVLLGGRLFTLMALQIGFAWLARTILTIRLPGEVRDLRQAPAWDRQIVAWAWTPLWRGTLGMLATIGTYRMAGVFLAATGIPGFASTFLLAQNLLNTAYQFAAAPLKSQMPRYSRMLAMGKGREIIDDSIPRILTTALALGGIVVLIGISAPVLLELIKANISFLDPRVWLLLGGLRTAHHLVTSLGMVHNVTNQMAFYGRNVVAAIMSLPFFYIGMVREDYTYMALGLFVPSLLILNIFPLKKFLELGDYGLVEFWKVAASASRSAIRRRVSATKEG